MTKPREKKREELQAEIDGTEERKSGSSRKSGKKALLKGISIGTPDADNGWSSEAQSLRALCRKPRP